MNLSIFGVNRLSSLFAIPVIVTAIVISQPVVVTAKTAPEVAKIAKQITVQINSK